MEKLHLNDDIILSCQKCGSDCMVEAYKTNKFTMCEQCATQESSRLINKIVAIAHTLIDEEKTPIGVLKEIKDYVLWEIWKND